MAWLRVSDPAGMAEVTLFSEVLARRRDILTAGRAVLVTADIKIEGEAIRITAADVVDLEHVAAEAAGGAIRVWVDRIDALEPIRQVLSRGPKGRGSIILVPSVDAARRVEIVLPETCAVTPRLAQALKSLPGVARVEET